MKKLLVVALGFVTFGTLAAVGSALAVAEEVREGVPAKLVEEARIRMPKDDAFRGSEGFAVVSYVIQEDGSVDELLVEESFGGASIERAILSGIRKRRYEPARLGGEAVKQCHSKVVVTMTQGEDGGRITRPIAARLRRASKKLKAGDLEAAKKILVESKPQTIAGGVRVALLRAEIARAQGDQREEKRQLVYSTVHGGKFLRDPDLLAAVVRRLIVISAQQNRYAEVRGLHDALQELGPEANSPTVQQVRDRVDLALASEAPLVTAAKVPPARGPGHAYYARNLARRVIGIEDVKGSIDHVDLRCEYHRATWAPKPGRAWRVPDEWGRCYFIVFGDAGSTFKLLEYPDSKVAEAPAV